MNLSERVAIGRAEEAFAALMQQINHLLDHVDDWLADHPAVDASSTFQHKQMIPMIETLGALPIQLADVFRRFKKQDERLLSRVGVELQLLNEIWVTLDSLTMFLCTSLTAEADSLEVLYPYNRSKAVAAYAELKEINRLFT